MEKRSKAVGVRYYAVFGKITGKNKESIEISNEATLNELLESLVNKYGEEFGDKLFGENNGEVRNTVNIFLNSERANEDLNKGGCRTTAGMIPSPYTKLL
ncbi:hypothetical protein C9439_05850 [archaeon SCG-AAA382B04]|nr:hypothetical protein C9439_05850 [archaeon SCG-AAA382B04]